MKHNHKITYKDITLRPIAEQDLELLRNWRNDVQTTTYLAKIPTITSEMQQAWFKKDQADPTTYTFAIERNDTKELVGSVAMYNIEGEQAEFGRIFIGDLKHRGKGYGFKGLAAVVYFAFEGLGITKLVASVYENNERSATNLLAQGFVVVGKRYVDEATGYDLDMELSKADFLSKFDFVTAISIER